MARAQTIVDRHSEFLCWIVVNNGILYLLVVYHYI